MLATNFERAVMTDSNGERSQPKTPAEYGQRATECERLAASYKPEKYREMFLYIAARWQLLADAHEALAGGAPTTPNGPSPLPE